MTIALVIPDISQGLAEAFMRTIEPFTINLSLQPATADERRIYCPAYMDCHAWTIWDDTDENAESDETSADAAWRNHNHYLHYYWLVFYAGRATGLHGLRQG